jgi:glycerol kinase
VTETTALGAAYLAGLSTGYYSDVSELSKLWRVERRFLPTLGRDKADEAMARWERAVRQATAA